MNWILKLLLYLFNSSSNNFIFSFKFGILISSVSFILFTQSVWYVNVCITLYSFPFILYNLIVLSVEPEAKIPELNCIIHIIASLCSLIVKSGLNVLLLYIIIEWSPEPVTNLPSFNTVEQFT